MHLPQAQNLFYQTYSCNIILEYPLLCNLLKGFQRIKNNNHYNKITGITVTDQELKLFKSSKLQASLPQAQEHFNHSYSNKILLECHFVYNNLTDYQSIMKNHHYNSYYKYQCDRIGIKTIHKLHVWMQACNQHKPLTTACIHKHILIYMLTYLPTYIHMYNNTKKKCTGNQNIQAKLMTEYSVFGQPKNRQTNGDTTSQKRL